MKDHTEVLSVLRAYALLDDDARDEVYDGLPPGNIEDVLSDLGCMAVLGPDDEGGPGYRPMPTPMANETAYVKKTLLEIYDDSDIFMDLDANPRLALLQGLCQNELWRECLASPRDPLKFAHLVLYWAGRVPMWPAEMRCITEPAILPALNEWLKPSKPWRTTPSVELLCAQMFGPSWWAVRRPDLTDQPFEIAERVLAERVEFQPGVIPGERALEVMDLPAFG